MRRANLGQSGDTQHALNAVDSQESLSQPMTLGKRESRTVKSRDDKCRFILGLYLMTAHSRGELHISHGSKGDKAGVTQHLGRKAGGAIAHPDSR